MRAFVAISIPEEIKNRISEIQNQIPKFNGKLTEKENLHLTLKFLGEISQDLLENVKSAIANKIPNTLAINKQTGHF